MHTPPPGLRERKKEHTRSALSRAAVRQTVTRGFDAVLVGDIAEEVGVSPRTFNNYFASKAEAVTAHHLDRMRSVEVVLSERPVGEDLWTALAVAVLGAFSGADAPADPDWLHGVRALITHPVLQAEMLRANDTAQRELATVIGVRTGTDPARELYPNLAAAALGTAVQMATTLWAYADPPVAFAPLLREALDHLTAGLPEPR